MKSNEQLQKDVQDELGWSPLLTPAEVGVIVNEGVVTLTGMVNSYAKKIAAQEAAKRVVGVKAIAGDIKVRLGDFGGRTDAEIASTVLNALKWRESVPSDRINVEVENGWVTLTGRVNWNFQLVAAEDSVQSLSGVKAVTNYIIVDSDSGDKVEKVSVENALERNAQVDHSDIDVSVSQNIITLSGSVYSLFEKEEAGRIAWLATGVRMVNNDLIVHYDY